MFLNSDVCFLLYVISVPKKWKVNCYIFLMILQKKTILQYDFHLDFLLLSCKTRKENDTLKIRLEFFPQI